MCLYPKMFKNPKYTATKKNGGNIPPVTDIRVLYVPIKCNKCIECQKQKARDLQVRLLEDIKHNTNGKFITLTFSNDSICELYKEVNSKTKLKGYALDNATATRAVRLFLERWRKKYKKSLRHWLVSELGHNGTENIHLHGIVWCSTEQLEQLEKIWQYGYVWKGQEKNGKLINYVNDETVGYICKYVSKQDDKHKLYTPIVLTSPGIGSMYLKGFNSRLNKFKGESTNETYRTSTGHKINLPIYYRNKLYSDEEREKLWLLKVDKQERWVMGNKIDVSKGYEEYFNALKYARIINNELGYNNNKKDWEREEYENYMRIMNQKKRMKRNNN